MLFFHEKKYIFYLFSHNMKAHTNRDIIHRKKKYVFIVFFFFS